ncbi:MAG: tRNA (cytidine(34)-2'-O)-methyltransferase [Wenzhouxiangellaceae bacterium]|nr:tRNA (cytidine(34)-2'-O)-methyltransferase [Wenzhouxiangellaceae bacterium]MBS3747840.1 tRNA (cytidine(34)-2'-O)-methyltransferase [Wenzhouxiangellaceae bacterium]MBS3824725.1 tRNA (cytidine(34)-2'-O)-methyltransferase [Wenzhouxiangellaceae bacterium]
MPITLENRPQIVLYQPEIPPNTGNLIRLCANTGTRLHLVRPLGFALDDRRLRRAGLDHFAREVVEIHADLEAAVAALGARRWLALTTRGSTRYDRVEYRSDDVLLFGPETRGLPDAVLDRFAPEERVKIPQRAEARSLNLSNAAAVVFYEAWRQLGFR